jgi:pimeloyl-ACP methyl ester carboxylesterase
MIASSSQFLTIRGVRYHVRMWGDPAREPLFLLHGWRDVSASFAWVAEHLCDRWRLVAPDWRGYGLTQWPQGEYWIPDYVADLDALVDAFGGGAPARLVGHSMGANLATIYAAAYPAKVASLACVEGFGLPAEPPEAAPVKLLSWLESVKREPLASKPTSVQAVAASLQRNNSRMTPARADALAPHFVDVESTPPRARNDPRLVFLYPTPFRQDEWLALLSKLEADVLWVVARDSNLPQLLALSPEQWQARRSAIRRRKEVSIDDAGHGVHYEQPEALARVLRAHFA